MEIKASLDDYGSPDAKAFHRKVEVETRHSQVMIRCDKQASITISKHALRRIVKLIEVLE